MGQVESTIFDDAPPWDMKMILKLTQLKEEEVNFCWKTWATNPSTKKGKIDSEAFKELFEIADDDDKGGLISKSLSLLAQISQKRCQNLAWALST